MKQNTNIRVNEVHWKMSSAKCQPILFRLQCVKTCVEASDWNNNVPVNLVIVVSGSDLIVIHSVPSHCQKMVSCRHWVESKGLSFGPIWINIEISPYEKSVCCQPCLLRIGVLTHCALDKNGKHFATAFGILNVLFSLKFFVFWFKFHWGLVLTVQLTIISQC